MPSPIPNARLFKPGQSGNPFGPAAPAMRLAAQARKVAEEMFDGAKDGEGLIRALIEIARHPKTPMRDRITALGMVLDGGWGRPKETIDLRAEGTALALTPEAVSKLSDAELAQAVALVTRLRELAAEGSQMPQDAASFDGKASH